MSTDIRLDEGDGNVVVVVGNVLQAQVTDLIIDSPSRRTNTNGSRRALVHDQADGLTINFNDDYPGGVTINGVNSLAVKGDIEFRISHHNAVVGQGHGPFGGPIHELDEVLSLAAVIVDLRNQVAALKTKVGI